MTDAPEAMRGAVPSAQPDAVDAAGRDGVRVKALEWHTPTDHPMDDEDAKLVANGIGGRYSISPETSLHIGGRGHLLWWAHDGFTFAEFRSVDEAKAAAQADFRRRVLSCHADAPQPVGSQGEAVKPMGVLCSGCGSSWDDERLRLEQARNPNIIACCPERRMIPVYAAPSTAPNAEASLRDALEKIVERTNRHHGAYGVALMEVREMAVAALNGSRT